MFKVRRHFIKLLLLNLILSYQSHATPLPPEIWNQILPYFYSSTENFVQNLSSKPRPFYSGNTFVEIDDFFQSRNLEEMKKSFGVLDSIQLQEQIFQHLIRAAVRLQPDGTMEFKTKEGQFKKFTRLHLAAAMPGLNRVLERELSNALDGNPIAHLEYEENILGSSITVEHTPLSVALLYRNIEAIRILARSPKIKKDSIITFKYRGHYLDNFHWIHLLSMVPGLEKYLSNYLADHPDLIELNELADKSVLEVLGTGTKIDQYSDTRPLDLAVKYNLKAASILLSHPQIQPGPYTFIIALRSGADLDFIQKYRQRFPVSDLNKYAYCEAVALSGDEDTLEFFAEQGCEFEWSFLSDKIETLSSPQISPKLSRPKALSTSQYNSLNWQLGMQRHVLNQDRHKFNELIDELMKQIEASFYFHDRGVRLHLEILTLLAEHGGQLIARGTNGKSAFERLLILIDRNIGRNGMKQTLPYLEPLRPHFPSKERMSAEIDAIFPKGSDLNEKVRNTFLNGKPFSDLVE